MNYLEQKQNLINQRKSILADYYRLYLKVGKFAIETKAFEESIDSKENYEDYTNYTNDEEYKKLERLAVSLAYVEKPNNEEIVDLLNEIISKDQQDIKVK